MIGNDYANAREIADGCATDVINRAHDFMYYHNSHQASRVLSPGSQVQDVKHLPSVENHCGQDWCTCGRCGTYWA